MTPITIYDKYFFFLHMYTHTHVCESLLVCLSKVWMDLLLAHEQKEHNQSLITDHKPPERLWHVLAIPVGSVFHPYIFMPQILMEPCASLPDSLFQILSSPSVLSSLGNSFLRAPASWRPNPVWSRQRSTIQRGSR